MSGAALFKPQLQDERGASKVEALPQSVAETIISYLAKEGVSCVFGVPGGNLGPFYEALGRFPSIRPILCKHEEGGSFMADGYARVSHSLGVCCGIAGPGATHALTGVAGAFCDSVPMLFISGQVATTVFGRGAIQDGTGLGVDLVSLFRPVTKLSAMLVNAESTPRLVERAIRSALTGRPGPVHLNLPGDVARMRLSKPPPLQGAYRPISQSCDLLEVAHAASILESAERPAIIAGNGVNLVGAWDELRNLAESTGIPVATTPKGKGAFPENHPLSLGIFGFAGHERASAYLTSGVDVLLVVGSSLGEFQTGAWDPRLTPSRALIQVDIDPAEIGKNYPAQIGIVADARMALVMLDAELSMRKMGAGRLKSLSPELLSIPRYLDADRAIAEATPIKPQRLVTSLRRVLPDDALIFLDIGNCLSWMLHYFEVREPGTFFVNLGFACMGWSIPAAIGGQLAAPNRTVVSVVGDGAFAMMGMEVHTAVEYELPVIFIVLNDSGLGMVDQGETLALGKCSAPTRYQQTIDVSGIAHSLGAAAFRVDSPAVFEDAVREAQRLRRPCVIDVRIDPTEIPAGLRMRSANLKRMFEVNDSGPKAG